MNNDKKQQLNQFLDQNLPDSAGDFEKLKKILLDVATHVENERG